MKPQYSMVIQWSADDDCYVVYTPDFSYRFMQPCTHGETYEEAAKHGEEVIESMIGWLEDDGEPLPTPKVLTIDGLVGDSKVA
ncbi:MAG: type II toxin-antitoxin system HicB family antitoxin [Cyanobacteria bacterium P01_A01_bin.116]